MKFKKCKECDKEVNKEKNIFCSKKCSAKHNRTTPLIDKETLNQEYLNNKLEVKDISQKYNVSVNTIFNYLKKYEIPLRGKHIDYSQTRIDKIFVIKAVDLKPGPGKHVRWECICDCGYEFTILSNSLNTRTSMQCCKCARLASRSNVELKNYIWAGIKRGAESRKIEFNITQEEAYDLFLKQNRKCKLSNVDISFAKCASDHFFKKMTTASLDRIDSKKGYYKENIQWVHKYVNIMKWQMTNQEFIEWCKIITNNN